MNPAESRWLASEAAGEATRVCGSPVHAFWPLLAPSFRWVLLPPHRRADGDRITWEWRGEPAGRAPLPADLEDLRLRLRDGLDLLEDELKRAPALPERVSADELRDAMQEALHDLRFGPDAKLVAHAVYTTRGWMLRSWGFPKPSPARSDSKRNQDDDMEPREHASPPAVPFARSPGSARRPPMRRLVAGLLGATLACGLGFCGRHGADKAPARTHRETPPSVTFPALAPGKPAKAAPEAAASPRPSQVAGPPAPQSGSPARASATSVAAHAAPNPRHATESAPATPLAITGILPTMPGAQAGRAGPPSPLSAKSHPDPAPPLSRPDSPSPAPERAGSGEDPVKPPPPRHEAGTPPPDASASKSAPAPATPARFAEAGGIEGRPTKPITPPSFPVEAREAPDPGSATAPRFEAMSAVKTSTSKPPSSPDNAPAALAQRPAPAARETPSANETAPAVPLRFGKTDAASSAAPSVTPAAPSTRWPPTNTPELKTIFQGRPMPWRLVLERDAPLPTRPSEGAPEEEMRAARISAWAQARALLPTILRRRDGGRVGWTLRFAEEAGSEHGLAWRDTRSGELLPATMAATAGRSASIGWIESETKDLDAVLVDEAGRAWARVRRSAAENRTHLESAAEIVAARPWFALRVGEGDGSGELRAPAGWELVRRGDELVAEGPADATRFRWEHPPSGWVLHGGYARDSR